MPKAKPEVRAEALKALSAGERPRDVAKRLGVHETTVYDWRAKAAGRPTKLSRAQGRAGRSSDAQQPSPPRPSRAPRIRPRRSTVAFYLSHDVVDMLDELAEREDLPVSTIVERLLRTALAESAG